MASDTESDIAALHKEFAQLRKDFATISTTIQNLVRHGGEEALAHGQSSAEKLRKEADRLIDGAIHHVEEKPAAAALGAFAFGLLLGMIFNARRG
jgi:ElaB/YqjD/DUF883 family membrane-anchored ribosome-binding protein